MTYNALCIEDDALFRKNVLSIQKHDFESKRINKVDNMRQNKSGKNNSVRYPELPTYNFAGTPKEIVNSLRNVEANIRWPKKYDQPGKAKKPNHMVRTNIQRSTTITHTYEDTLKIMGIDRAKITVLRKPELTGRLAKWNIYLSGFDIEFKPKTAIKSQTTNPGYSSNVRGSGLGVVLKSSQGGNMVYSIRIRCEFKATNNEAEYEALIAGLDIAYKLGARHLNARSDSLLIVNQVNGDFQAKDSKMMSYLKIVKDRVARFDHFAIEQIPRDLNTQADALANLGSAFNEPTLESIPIIHLMTPTNKTKEEVPMNEDIYNWSLDIWNYLKHKQLLEDKKEA
ncbi:hypothetical protein OSB04_017101 [Centaurea solstitialis]|uniref:RNase H type-1 domain-containing protein n=1 Tax=Centaurea solstitialis TaxID=347529 RepID=A0AA38WLQ8_9ASTR|nr:hypothetical protein OSB04_017101 [Centaurea solstitialis]